MSTPSPKSPHDIERKVARVGGLLAVAVLGTVGLAVTANYLHPQAARSVETFSTGLSLSDGLAPSRTYHPTLVSRASGDPTLRTGFGNLKLAAPITYENLTVFPVYAVSAKAARTGGRAEFATLGQAMSNGATTLTEPGAGMGNCPAGVTLPPASVTNASEGAEHRDANLLLVANPGKDPTYVPDGTVVPGGDQDRGVAADTIVPAKSANVLVAAFCVEHNRSSGATPIFNKDIAIAMPSVRYAMQVVGEQQPVWNAVAVAARRGKSETGTGTYHALIANADLQKHIMPYADALTLPVQAACGKGKPIGVVVAVNGHVVCADLYRSSELFAQLWPSLLRSYATQAVIDPKPGVQATDKNTAGVWLAQMDRAPGAQSRHADLTRVARVVAAGGAGIRTAAMTNGDPAKISLLHEAFWTPEAALTN